MAMYKTITTQHPNEFYCRECRSYYAFSNKDFIVGHYLSHIQFLEVLIKDLDIKIDLEENIDEGTRL